MLNKNKLLGYFLFWIIACNAANVLAQTGNDYNKYITNVEVNMGKRPLELNDLKDSWLKPQFGDFAAISRDGRYCSYTIIGSKEATIVQATESGRKYYLKGIKTGFFSADNRYYVYQTSDSLCYLSLRDGSVIVQKDVTTYQVRSDNAWVLVQFKNNHVQLKNYLTGASFQLDNVRKAMLYHEDWFVCQLNNAEKELMTVNLKTGKVQRYKNVSDYGFDKSNRVLILNTEKSGEKGLVWVDAQSGKMNLIWSGAKGDQRCIGNYQIDKMRQGIVFTLKPTLTSDTIQSLWYYKQGMKAAIEKPIEFAEARFSGLKVSAAPEFSSDGEYLVFSIRKKTADTLKAKPNAVQVDVWNYQDTVLMSAQLATQNATYNPWATKVVYRFSIPCIGDARLKYLSGEYENLSLPIGEYAFIQRKIPTDRFWDSIIKPENVFVSLKDGKIIPIKKGIEFFHISPDGTWLLCYDSETGQYLRFDVGSGQYLDLSGAEHRYFGGESRYSGAKPQPRQQRGLVGWLDGGKYVLVYDHYDIWKLDVTCKNKAINLTNGRKDNIRFEAVTKDFKSPVETFLNRSSTITLTSWNMNNMDNAIYTLALNSNDKPEKLFGGPYMLYLGGLKYGHSFYHDLSNGRKPLKARDANVWIVLRQSTSEAPNYYVSRSLGALKALTDMQPHADYNWLKSSLVSFTQVDGSIGKGILYKPENFDPSRKYPVIIHYYDQFSTCLNQYPVIGLANNAFINIPWFVSRGYLVFLPDIYFNKGAEDGSVEKELKIPIGEASLNAIEGAASWLAAQSYMDSTKMGIAGHSMGGSITNYVLTHSTRFAAVFEGAGASDWISSSLQVSCVDGNSRLGIPYYSGATGSDIWTNHTKYLDNPILHVGSITSPLLIFHCKKDSALPFEQAVELFVAMRRMGKKAWMLQYDQGDHATSTQQDDKDLTIRATQFFDHYLKGAPAPIWMTRGVRAELKGVQTGLEFDPEIKTPVDAKFIK